MACDCADQVNEKLADRNGFLDFAMMFNGDVTPTMLSVVKKDRGNRKKPPQVLPTFCPFCGSRYVPLAAAEVSHD